MREKSTQIFTVIKHKKKVLSVFAYYPQVFLEECKNKKSKNVRMLFRKKGCQSTLLAK